MKRRILIEDRPPPRGDFLRLIVLPVAIVVLAGIGLRVILR